MDVDQVKRKHTDEDGGSSIQQPPTHQNIPFLKEEDIKSEESPNKKQAVMWSGGKNPVQLLHEKFQDIEYEFSQDGVAHEPKFKVKAQINGENFEAIGLSKQKAKSKVAVLALRQLGFGNILGEELTDEGYRKEAPIWNYEPFGTKSPIDLNLLNKQKSENLDIDFTSDNTEFFESQMPGRERDERLLYAPPSSRNSGLGPWGSNRYSPTSGYGRNGGNGQRPGVAHIMGPMSPPQAVAHKFSQLFSNRPAINVEKARTFPVMVLSEIFPDIKIEWTEGSGRGDRQFKVEAEVQGRRFFGEGRSKKIAKLNLAKTILLCMYDIHDFKDAVETTPKSSQKKSTDHETQMEKKFPLTQLKTLAGDDLTIDVQQQDELNDQGEKIFIATIVVRGVAYEAIGKHKNLARLRAAKKALDSLRPKKEGGSDSSLNDSMNSDSGPKEVDTTRHPTMVFYEMYRDVQFNCEETKGSNGLNEYLVEAEVEGKKYTGKACSKKKAKLRLVLNAFEDLRDIPLAEWSGIDLNETMEDRTLSNNPAANHPIVLLLKLNPQTRFVVTEDYDCEITSKYKAIAYVGDRQFSGEGPNKKCAKTVAARGALQELFGIDADNYVEETRNDIFEDNEPKKEVPVELSNRIADAVQKKFLEVFQGETQCKVIAAFVVADCQTSIEEPDLRVVSIGTGTKCITGEMIDHKGQTLNDCHGEIIACRGFRRFMFDELIKALKSDEDTLFERIPSTKKYRLKAQHKIYLFVNTAPCGDGRVFTLQTQQQQGAKNKTAGLLRTKIENGQGTIPVPENNIQTSDGILEGERLRTMSCSDKILKWNALGVQGALLSYFIDPIYLEGIVIGLHYNYDALCRALYKRAIKMDDCPGDYRLNRPALGSPNNMETSRDTSKATSNSFNWYHQERTAEAVNATNGKTVILTPSRLCKLNFFDKFMQSLKLHPDRVEPRTYQSAKSYATDYQKTKELFFKSLEDTTCGKWIGKPYEHDMFGY
eukprot:TCONS_00019671-protein